MVTGGACGIGREVSAACAERGAHVVVADIDGAAAGGVAASARSAERVRLDNTDVAAVAAPVAYVVGRRGSIDVLVNRDALDLTEAEYDEIMNINVKRTWLPCQASARCSPMEG